MKRRVEACHRRELRLQPVQGSNRPERGWVVEGRELRERLKALFDPSVQEHRGSQLHAAVHHPVAHRVRLRRSIEEARYHLGLVPRRGVAAGKHLIVGAQHPQLDRRGARVHDEDGGGRHVEDILAATKGRLGHQAQ
jgi:hypothetical protein